MKTRDERGLRMPIFLISRRKEETFLAPYLKSLHGVVIADLESRDFYEKRLKAAIESYAESLLTPFFGALMQYDYDANRSWACPGHQGGQMFMRHPVGRLFFEHMGENIFRDDICNAMVSLGDLLIHEGPALKAQQAAARTFGSDRTYFVLNGTSSSNKVVNTALLSSKDIVLFDRNNHKSNHHGALFIAGAIPVYLQADRNGFGMVGPIDWAAFDEENIRAKLKSHPRLKGTDAWKRERPIRVAIVEQCTYDGTVYNARKVLEKIGHLCEYIHFDEAWAGFGAFHPLMADHFAMSLKLTDKDPGIIATQSTHKQLAGFSQASQIHVRDCPHPRQAIPDQPQAVQRDVHAAGIDVAVLPAVLQPGRQCADACRQGRARAVGRHGEARHRGAQGGAQALRRLLRSVRAGRGQIPGQVGQVGGRADRRAGEGAGLLAARSPARNGTATAIWARTRPWSIRPSSC